jgi:hypothetical protein
LLCIALHCFALLCFALLCCGNAKEFLFAMLGNAKCNAKGNAKGNAEGNAEAMPKIFLFGASWGG